MASERTVLRIVGEALWDPKPTRTDLQARQLAVALGYPTSWRVVRTREDCLGKDCIVDRIYAGPPKSGCDMWFHHAAAMKAAENWVEGESTPHDAKGGHLLPRLPKYEKGDQVQVLYEDEWWNAKIVRRKEHADTFRYQVQYSADNSKQSGVSEEFIRDRPSAKDAGQAAHELGLGEGWQAVSQGGKRWKITSPTGEVFKSKKAALEAFMQEATKEKDMADGDPPWRTTGNEYLGRRVLWTMKHAVSARRTVTVAQMGEVVGFISETDVDTTGDPGFVSERTGQPAKLFHILFDDDPHHPYASHLVQSQDVEEYELLECLLPEGSSPPKKKARKR